MAECYWNLYINRRTSLIDINISHWREILKKEMMWYPHCTCSHLRCILSYKCTYYSCMHIRVFVLNTEIWAVPLWNLAGFVKCPFCLHATKFIPHTILLIVDLKFCMAAAWCNNVSDFFFYCEPLPVKAITFICCEYQRRLCLILTLVSVTNICEFSQWRCKTQLFCEII